MAFFGNPQDILSTPYGYAGQMSPEAAVQEQALNRRRLIANLLTQQSLQPSQGRQAGRFYVAPSAWEGGARLAQALAGALGGRMIDTEQKDIVEKDTKGAQDFIKDWQAKQKLLQAMNQAPSGAAPSPPSPAPPMAPEAAIPPSPPLPESAGSSPPAQLPDTHTGVSDFRAPSFVDAGKTTIPGLSPEVTPGDMSTMVNSADPAKAQAQLGEQPPLAQPPIGAPVAPPPAPAEASPQAIPPGGAPRKTTMEDLAGLLTHQHPMVRSYGAMLAQQMQKEQMTASEREFTASEHDKNRAVQREGIQQHAAATTEQVRGNIIANQMRLDQMEREGIRDAAAKTQADATRAEIAKQTAQLKEMEIKSASADRRYQSDALKAIAQTKQQAKGAIPTKALELQGDELTAIGAATGIQKDMASLRAQLDSGGLKLGPVKNFFSEAKNYAGMSDEQSRNLASFKATLERMRNESLRLNKGVQTEGDSVRAWNELLSNINDPAMVKQRLAEIEAQNERAVLLRKNNIDVIRQNYGADPLDTTGFQNQAATVGANAPKKGGPAVGVVEDGYRFKGGNPSDPKAWEKVQ